MHVGIHLSPWGIHEPGRLVLISIDAGCVYALSVRWDNQEESEDFLILEGARVGDTAGSHKGVLAYCGSAEVMLSKCSADWQFQGLPRAPLAIGIAGNEAYFVFKSDSQICTVNIQTGAATTKDSKSLRIANAWSIREVGEEAPFVESPAVPRSGKAEATPLHI